jgi:hypothetical protein
VPLGACVFALGAALCGCGAAPGAAQLDALDGGDAQRTARTARTDDTDRACAAGRYVETVTAAVLDERAHPLADAKVQLCVREASTHQLLCLRPVSPAADGAVTVTVPERARCLGAAAMRVMVPYADLTTSYCQLDLISGSGGRIHVPEPVVLYDTQRATVLPAEGDATAERWVRFNDGLAIGMVPERYRGFGAGYQALAAARLTFIDSPGQPTPADLCFVAGDSRPEVVYGLSPEGSVSGPGFALEIPNATGLPAGTRVRLSVLGGLSCSLDNGTLVPEGQWTPYGTARVSSDGRAIIGGRLPCFTWFGYGLGQN